MLAQTIGSKVVGFLGQIVLAWLLVPEEFGLVSLALVIMSFAGIVQQSGVREVLIRRHAHFGRWENSAFWLSIASGLAALVLVVAAAPIAEMVFAAPGLAGLAIVLSLAFPANAIAAIPAARLQGDLRFRLVSLLGVFANVGTTALSITFASPWFDLGAYSLVLPVPLIALCRMAALLAIAPPKVRWDLQFHRWSRLLPDSGLVIATAICITVCTQGDYAILGLLHDETVVGVYSFAFNLSSQTTQLLAINLASVLFPALSRLQAEPRRQTEGFLRASRTLALIGIPLCILQAALSRPLIHLIFPAKWVPAIPVLQLLSLGMAVQVATITAGSMMQAQGRFKTLFYVSLLSAVLFLVMVVGGAISGGAISVALVVSAYLVLTGPVHMYAALRPGAGTWHDVSSVFFAPVTASAVAIVPAWLVIENVASLQDRHMVNAALVVASAATIYPVAIARLAPETWRDCKERGRELASRVTGLRRTADELRTTHA